MHLQVGIWCTGDSLLPRGTDEREGLGDHHCHHTRDGKDQGISDRRRKRGGLGLWVRGRDCSRIPRSVRLEKEREESGKRDKEQKNRSWKCGTDHYMPILQPGTRVCQSAAGTEHEKGRVVVLEENNETPRFDSLSRALATQRWSFVLSYTRVRQHSCRGSIKESEVASVALEQRRRRRRRSFVHNQKAVLREEGDLMGTSKGRGGTNCLLKFGLF